jgi:hypothetical protein
LRELLVASLIRLYARLLKQGFDIIPALCAGIDMTDDYHDLEHGPTVAFFFKSGI